MRGWKRRYATSLERLHQASASSARRVARALVMVPVPLLWALSASATPAVTPGAVSLSTTFEVISVRAQFSGDDNGNASASIRFMKHSGDTGWHSAYTPYIDRRPAIGGTANPYANEARVAIVGLAANTAYDVQVTWTDPDGVSGSQPAAQSVTTLSYTPPTSGSTITVTDDASLASALQSASPGQIIHLNPGTYSPFAINASGAPSAWIVIQGDPAGTTVIGGTSANQNILVNANYVMVAQLTLAPSDANGIVLAAGVHHVFVQDNVLQNVSTQCAVNPTGHYGDTGILIGPNAANIFVLRNAIRSAALSQAACTLQPIYASPGAGIGWTDVKTLVVKNNIVTGGFRDAISSDTSSNFGADVDLEGNTVTGFKDDGVESKGGNLNVRMWSNNIPETDGDSCIAGNTNTSTNLYGPLYIFRNTCRVTSPNSSGQTGYKLGGAPTFLFHNSIDSSLAPVHWDTYVSSTPLIVINNIAKSSGSLIDYVPSAASLFDYNMHSVTSGASYSYLWNGTTTYNSAADFKAGTGQESHTLNVDPLFLDTALHLNAASPAIDKGLILPNFNSLDSAWPYTGAGPDIGAFELRVTVPAVPTGLHVQE